jgi:hypothetical protein
LKFNAEITAGEKLSEDQVAVFCVLVLMKPKTERHLLLGNKELSVLKTKMHAYILRYFITNCCHQGTTLD